MHDGNDSPPPDDGLFDPTDEQDLEADEADYHIASELQDQLMIMGFPEEWCALALRENGNDIMNASSWIVDNLDMLTRLSELHKAADEQCEMEDDDDDGDDDDDEEEEVDDDGEDRSDQDGEGGTRREACSRNGEEVDDRSSEGMDEDLLGGKGLVRVRSAWLPLGNTE